MEGLVSTRVYCPWTWSRTIVAADLSFIFAWPAISSSACLFASPPSEFAALAPPVLHVFSSYIIALDHFEVANCKRLPRSKVTKIRKSTVPDADVFQALSGATIFH